MQLLTQKMLIVVLAAVSLVPVAAPAADLSINRPKLHQIWNRVELYFGTDRETDPPVSDADFFGFLDGTVTPLFPDGLTLVSGYGQFFNSKGVLVKERSKVLIILYPPHSKDANRNIQHIRDEYKTRFSQESVLRVDSYAVVSF
jgi:hypothetical protein